jgi:uncharacterized protein YlxW (UPF0749 family)
MLVHGNKPGERRAARRASSRLGPQRWARASESEVLAQELSNIADKVGALETRVKEVEAVIERLESAAETTARALEEVSAHWDAVYRAMRRAE